MQPPIPKNITPPLPNPSCPVPPPTPSVYSTDQQSDLNVSRTDKFKIILDVPNMLKPYLKKESRFCHGGNIDRLVLSIWGYIVPEIKINTLDVKHAGQALKFSGLSRPAYNPITVNFTVDNRYDNYFILWKWMNIQNDAEHSTFDARKLEPNSTGKLSDYSSIFTVVALDEYNKPKATWEFSDAFPIGLGPLNISSRQIGELDTSFTFEFSQLTMKLI